MAAFSTIAGRAHASTVLVVVGSLIAAAGSSGCSYWHHVGMQAGPNIFIAGVLITLLEMRVIGWHQALAQIALIVPLFWLPMHVH
jgi:hypothetical protein